MSQRSTRQNDDRPPERSAYEEPFGWWGYHWTVPDARSLIWLIEHGMLDVPAAACLSLAVEARASMIVVAEPHEAGKTTLLTALLDFLPEQTRPIYLRGWYERFTFLDDVPADEAYVLCNEISAHLPTYLWGRGVRRIFEAAFAGYPLATTMHAASGSDALNQLASFPLNVPPEHLTAIDLIVTIAVGYVNNRLLRRVSRIEIVEAGDDGPRVHTIAAREPLRAELDYQVGRLIGTVAALHGCDDDQAALMFARRVRQIEAWTRAGHGQSPSLRTIVTASRTPSPTDPR
jgi:hypothetical protein